MSVEPHDRRSASPQSTNTVDSLAASLPPQTARRIVHLMKMLNGRMSGNLVFRRGAASPWTKSYCYVKEDTASLMYEAYTNDGNHRKLVPDLRGCKVRPSIDRETPFLEITSLRANINVHIKLHTQADFDTWYAVLLYWSLREEKLGRRGGSSNGTVPSPRSQQSASVQVPARTSSAAKVRSRTRSKSERPKSEVMTTREAPVIKIGNMIYWDTNIGYSSSTPGLVGTPMTSRPQAYRMQSYGTRRWRRISGMLRENGELKLQSEADNSLISVVQLSQLSRCAIQRLDPSVLDNDFCIAIYPQYTSSLSNSQSGFMRPIFLSLENRVLFEVWFVLLRAFTIPQLYGPPSPEQNDADRTPDSEDTNAPPTTDMFRVERSLGIRVIEAKMYPPATSDPWSLDPDFNGAHTRSGQRDGRPEQQGYYAEVLLDNETRGKTAVKFEGLSPLWGESFDFVDLPPVLNSASVVIKRRPPDTTHLREQHESRLVHEAYGFTGDQHGGYTGLTFDVTCGKVEIYLQELEDEKEIEKWWPIVNTHNQRVGEVLIKARAEEGVILMAHDYQPLSELLHRFSNALTLQIASMIPAELKRLSDCLLNIFQVSGKSSDWLMALVEEEIDGVTKETPMFRLRYKERVGSNDSRESHGAGVTHSDRELIVRDMNRNAAVEANLLFRGNTLLTKSLDTHMRRVGKEYLEDSLAAKIQEINDKDPECEVDPNRVSSPQDLERNWRRLMLFTSEVWKSIVAAKSKCPIELRMIFRHIRACAEDRYGDFLRTVSYSSVSGFLFLRFFCPAVLNPKLFGLLKEDMRPRARRTFTLIAKSLQTLANMAHFGTKEHWMEPMNTFLGQHRESFKTLIDDVCYVPRPASTAMHPAPAGPPGFAAGIPSTETHLSYGTPMTIMQRLPPTSREGFPSLPYLIDQARAFADLVQLWLAIVSPTRQGDSYGNGTRRQSEIIHVIETTEGDLKAFHDICVSLNGRTQECLSRAERAERPNSALSFHWEEIIEQLQSNPNIESPDETAASQITFDLGASRLSEDPSLLPPGMQSSRRPLSTVKPPRQWDMVTSTDEDEEEEREENDEVGTMLYDPTPPHTSAASTFELPNPPQRTSTLFRDRPGSASISSSLRSRTAIASRGSDGQRSPSVSASASTSAVSSDTEHTNGTTALPNYEREIRHRERREAAKQQIVAQMEEAKVREQAERERRRGKTPLAALTGRRREGRKAVGHGSGSGSGSGQRGVDV
ncbi:hypothetical protein BAUCODRAFT_126409 [Baudoinia panamericana UAMH 10762]|uniref:Uncharacterized protein n=1 Tax=Baudoinia panamericana (strain UAMH 10762) TaxID=717646 RepID=M2LEK7_BAUPA|nr:uncharacterized protein BAUCODRAFT_126409 [Baudoinia panamericana UAMH 10762]EMC92427.1 hypothetical protein BAUCODRAFT_126409 [Baudoinia panamericana UAMH 10762]